VAQAGAPIKENLHQAAFTRVFDLTLARSASSFDKLYRDIQRLIEVAGSP